MNLILLNFNRKIIHNILEFTDVLQKCFYQLSKLSKLKNQKHYQFSCFFRSLRLLMMTICPFLGKGFLKITTKYFEHVLMCVLYK